MEKRQANCSNYVLHFHPVFCSQEDWEGGQGRDCDILCVELSQSENCEVGYHFLLDLAQSSPPSSKYTEVQGKLQYSKIVFCFHLHGVSVTTKLAMLIFGVTYFASSILVKHISCISKY